MHCRSLPMEREGRLGGPEPFFCLANFRTTRNVRREDSERPFSASEPTTESQLSVWPWWLWSWSEDRMRLRTRVHGLHEVRKKKKTSSHEVCRFIKSKVFLFVSPVSPNLSDLFLCFVLWSPLSIACCLSLYLFAMGNIRNDVTRENGDSTYRISSEVAVWYLENGPRRSRGPFSRYQTSHRWRYPT